MANFNLNSQYGSKLSLPFIGAGKNFFVGDSSTKNIDMLKSMFIPDADGVNRWFSTLDAALAVATADAGDVIWLMPGHTETVDSTGDVNLDVAGVTVIGIGQGDQIPLFDITTTGAGVYLSENDITLKNVRIRPGSGSSGCALGLVLNSTSAAHNITVDSVVFGPRSSVGAAFDKLMTLSTNSTGANFFDGLTIKNNVFQYYTSSITGAGMGFDFVTAAANNVRFQNNQGMIYSSAAGSVWQSSGTNYGWIFTDNLTINQSTANVAQYDFNGSLTYGIFGNNLIYSATTASAVGNLDLSYMVSYDSYMGNAQNEDRKMLLTPATPVS